MKRAPTTFEASVRAFRDMTAAHADGAATRARVLARASGDTRRWPSPRRAALLGAATVLAVSSASAAWMAAGRPGRAPAAAALEEPAESSGLAVPSKAQAMGRPVLAIASLPAPVSDEPATAATRNLRDRADADADASGRAEDRAYGRAHRAHFADDAPGAALAAWNAYLAAYPRGVFVPEARYNRALCLVRLGRDAEADRALRPFAEGRSGGYRRQEARVLLDWLAAKRPPD